MVGGFVALTRLVSNGTAAHITGDVGMSFVLGIVLRLLSEAVVFGGLAWALFTMATNLLAARRALDTIDRTAALRRLSRAATVGAAVLVYALCLTRVGEVLVGVPPELIAAAGAMVVAAPFESLIERLAHKVTSEPATQAVLPPDPEGTPIDSRADDPLERARRGALRQSMMGRR